MGDVTAGEEELYIGGGGITADVEDAEDATVAKERRDAPVVEEEEEAAAAEVDVDGVDA